MKAAKVKNILPVWGSFAATALMLAVIQPPIGATALAWVALVPFILVCSPGAKAGRLAIGAYVVGLCYWLGNLYWIYPVTVWGWAAFCVYTALLWPMLALGLRYCRIKKVPVFIAVPVLFVGAERLQGLFLGGFFWRFLGHSQYANITLIQIADIFGAAGVSFLVAIVNGLIAEMIIAGRGKDLFKTNLVLKAAVVVAAIAAAIVYGQWRVGQSDELVKEGPLVAAVQTNVPQSVKESVESRDIILEKLLELSGEAAGAGPGLIVWPETMVQATLDARVLKELTPSYHCMGVDKSLREHSGEVGFVLVGAYGGTPAPQEDLTIGLDQRYNSAFLYRPDGTQAKEQYHKIHLVPFGEIVPFKKSVPWLYELLMGFTPYDYDYSLDYGTEHTVFEMADPVRNSTMAQVVPEKSKISNGAGGQGQKQRGYRFSVMICYEDAIPKIARKFALDEGGRKRLDWLVNISNDGWFVRFDSDSREVFPSTELAQHTAVCAFRAVENRLAVVRSVNTGISCLIDTLGRVRDGFAAGSLPEEAMARKGVSGWFVDRVPIDKRTTFFSKYGQWLDFCCAAGLCLLIIVQALERFILEKRKQGR